MRDKLLSLLKPEADPSLKLSVVSLFIAKILETVESRLIDLEARQLQKGDRGDKGIKGDKGEKGDKGDVGPQGIQGIQGLQGPKGKDGKNGKDGKSGVSVVSADVDIDGHLTLGMSDGSVIDAGSLPEIVGKSGSVMVSGSAWQIIVSPTAPSHPQLNDLWLQI